MSDWIVTPKRLMKRLPPEYLVKPSWLKWRCYLCRTVNERTATCAKCRQNDLNPGADALECVA